MKAGECLDKFVDGTCWQNFLGMSLKDKKETMVKVALIAAAAGILGGMLGVGLFKGALICTLAATVTWAAYTYDPVNKFDESTFNKWVNKLTGNRLFPGFFQCVGAALRGENGQNELRNQYPAFVALIDAQIRQAQREVSETTS